MRISFWPRSLFGRLIAALVIAVVAAQAASLYVFAIHLNRFVLDSSVREWSRRITETTLVLQQLPPEQRGPAIARLQEQAARLAIHRERRASRRHERGWRGGGFRVPPPDSGAAPIGAPARTDAPRDEGGPELPPTGWRRPRPRPRMPGHPWPRFFI